MGRAGKPPPATQKLCQHRHSKGRGRGSWVWDRLREEEAWGQAGVENATCGQSRLNSARAVSGGSSPLQGELCTARTCSVRTHLYVDARTHLRTPQIVALLKEAIESTLACPPAETELPPSVTRGPLRVALALS